MSQPTSVKDPELERQGRRLGRPGWWFLLVAVLLAVPGVLLTVFATSWGRSIGIVLLVLAGSVAVVAMGLLLPSLISRWSARHKSFA